ncbi:MAG: GTP-binding protein, partial [Mogibacterium sp.]|nr:GTP-binding protein [Mogibacterium sp.]
MAANTKEAVRSETRRITLGVLAHVDAGKTTLSEALLYRTGELRVLGRVDHGDSFLDGNEIERNRGITVFSKQACLTIGGDTEVTLLDTPGHADFAAEMERVLSVLDYALLIISAPDGVQSHTETLWRLLRQRRIPVIVFVNKMDLAVREKETIFAELSERLGEGLVDFTREKDDESFLDEITLAVP